MSSVYSSLVQTDHNFNEDYCDDQQVDDLDECLEFDCEDILEDEIITENIDSEDITADQISVLIDIIEDRVDADVMTQLHETFSPEEGIYYKTSLNLIHNLIFYFSKSCLKYH